ncbi:hypothetical protein FF011L_19390 [Roseimaritima multifibrata]|uniref:Uncharacterized protein n=1 Tax=Roseimaritima multifibrata TaxID=1930274 RepID=A0A517ME66_9BACT|nr:hypothetical protein FF011L_19390 [Roseimaritima multifibrata]
MALGSRRPASICRPLPAIALTQAMLSHQAKFPKSAADSPEGDRYLPAASAAGVEKADGKARRATEFFHRSFCRPLSLKSVLKANALAGRLAPFR